MVLCALIIAAELAVRLWIHPTLTGNDIPGSIRAEWLAFHLAALIPGVLLAGYIESRRI